MDVIIPITLGVWTAVGLALAIALGIWIGKNT